MWNKIICTLLTLVALALTGPAAWAQLSVDPDIPEGTAGHWYVNMPSTDTNSLTLSADDLANGKATFKVYDDGGKNGNYSDYCYGYLTIYVPDGYVIQISGTVWTEAPIENVISVFLGVYDGSTMANTLAEVYSLSDGVAKDFGPLTTTGNALRLYFQKMTENPSCQGLDLTVTVFENTLYNVSVAEGIEHGSVVASPTTAYYNSDVTLTVTPDENYYIGTVSYNDGTDHVIKPVFEVYSFKMPKHDVTVNATFLAEEEYFWGEGNDGSEEYPYVIRDNGGWDLLVKKTKNLIDNDTNGKHFRLGADLVFVKQGLRFFNGYLDGNHHKITLSSAEGGFIGTSSEGRVNDLTLNGSVSGDYVIYYASGLSLTNCFINVTNNNETLGLVYNGTVLSTNCAYLLNGEATFAGGNTALNYRLPAYLLTLSSGAVAIRPDGTPIGDGSVTVYADGFTFGSAEYYKQYATVTFNVPGVSFASATYYDGSSSYPATINPADGSASFYPMPARAVTVSISGYTARYIDADGTEQTHSAALLTDGSTVSVDAGWYVVTGNVRITAGLRFSGDAQLILTDGATLSVGSSSDESVFQSAVRSSGSLSIYGQALGTGTLNARSVCKTMETSDPYRAYGIRAIGGDIALCGGNVNAEAVCDNAEFHGVAQTYSICADGDISIVRGVVSASCRATGGIVTSSFHGITAGEGRTITLGWGRTTDSIYSSHYSGTVKIADGQTLYKGSEALSGTIVNNEQISDQTLKPYPEYGTTLRARQATLAGQTRYWATFYHPTVNYELPTGAQAFYMGSDHALYRIGAGSIIPAHCAVVIMAESASITLTATNASAPSVSGNILQGTSAATTASTLVTGNQKVHVLSMSGETLGFFEYTGTDPIPANKAYYVE